MFRVIDARALFCTFLVCAAARADGDDACTTSYVSAQRLQRAGKLLGARAAMLTCAESACPSEIQTDCVQWLADLRRKLPSAVFSVRDARGRDVVDARVIVDGTLVASRIDGKAIDLDPGEHHVRFEPTKEHAHEVVVVMHEGEQDRAIGVDLPAPPMHRPVPAGVWVTGALGVAAFGAFGAFGAWGLADLGSLSYCKGMCFQGDVDRVNTKYAVADIALGVGVISLAVAVVWFITRPSVPLGTF